MCDVDQFLRFPSCQHLHLSIAQPADVSWDNLESLLRGDRAVDAPVVRLESWGYFDVAQSTFEGGNAFIALGNALLFWQDTSLTLAHVLGVLLCLVVDCRDSLLYKGSEDDDELGLEVTGWAWNKRTKTKTMMTAMRMRVKGSMVAVGLRLWGVDKRTV